MMVGCAFVFTPWQSTSKLALLIWLNENVGCAFVFSPWQSTSKLALLIWLNENVGLTYIHASESMANPSIAIEDVCTQQWV